MSFDVFIFGQPDLQLYPRLSALEEDLYKFLAPEGETVSVQALGTGWHIALWLEDEDGIGQEEWVARLGNFLRTWGVPPDTCFTILSRDAQAGTAFERVAVYSQER